MTLPVCQVTATLVDPSGDPITGARITAKLTAPIVYGGVVIPLCEFGTTDSAGKCVLSLCPNGVVATPTTYSFEILPQGSIRPVYFHGITVPQVAAITLEALLGGSGSTTVWDDTAMWDDTKIWAEA